VPDTGGRLEGIDVFAWTPREFVDLGLLEFCFTDANDAKNQLPFIRERVQQQLQRFAVDVEGRPGAIALRDPRDQPDGRWHGPIAAAPGGPDHRRPSDARRRARDDPRSRGRRARPGVDRPGPALDGLGLPPAAARGVGAARPPRARR
jgi:hypothetical protein